MQDRVVLDSVTVDFPIYDVTARSLKHRLVFSKISSLISSSTQHVGGSVQRNARGVVVVRALDAVNLALSDGDRVALVGHNGAGKTTLLRLVAGIFEPTAGEVHTNGRVMPMFNLLEGMTPDSTGIEMIRVRGALLGLSAKDIDERIDDIAEFCELGEYIGMPVRTYSTGMLARLAFAITSSVPSEILIMDEIIGVGDAAFIDRAEARLRGFVEQASVLLLATHSAPIVRQWCNKAVLLEHGRVVEFGATEDVLRSYERVVARGAA